MKSRVKKNQQFYETIASSTESDASSSGLSHFANRLNEIDDQFKKVEEPVGTVQEATRARQYGASKQPAAEKTDVAQQVDNFDTFESMYLKDFLDEVKEYNVKKNYREIGNTQQNIIRELNIFPDAVKPVDDREIVDVLNEIHPEDKQTLVSETQTEVPNTDDIETTRVFEAVDFNAEEPIEDIEKTIAMAVQEMVYEPETVESIAAEDSENTDDMSEEIIEESVVSFADDLTPDHALEDTLDDIGPFEFDPNKFKQELLDQTQTMHHKIIDQERNLEAIDTTMIRTNRMLNVVLSLLLMAVFVMIVILAKLI